MKLPVALLVYCATLTAQLMPISVGPNPAVWPPAIDGSGQSVLVSSSIAPSGQISGASDLYLLRSDGTVLSKLTSLSNNGATWVDLSPDGKTAAYNVTTSTPPGMEEIHVVDTSTAADRKIATDTVGCVQPLASAICAGCLFSCIRTVHFSPDASKVVYSASENQPLYVVNADGSGVLHLPVAQAALAPSPQRVISANGLLVFSGQDVNTIHLDGTALQTVTHLPPNSYPYNATISADACTIVYQSGTPAQLFVVHLNGSAPRQLTSDQLDSSAPSLSADGSLVAYLQGGQVFLRQTDGATPPARLTNFLYLNATAVTLSADGSKALVTARLISGNGAAVYLAVPGATPAPLYVPTAVLPNGVTSFSGAMAPTPGSLIKIQGVNFVNDTLVSAAGTPLPLTLAGLSASVNGVPMPTQSVSPATIVAQLPFEAAPGRSDFTVQVAGASELTVTATVQVTMPEVLNYTLPFFSTGYAMAFHAGTSIPADQAHPASAGEVLESYGVGLGAVNPAVADGATAPSNPPATVLAAPQVKIGNQIAKVTFAGLAPGLIGIYQVNVIVPSGLKPGAQPFSWSVNNNWTIYVQN
jgi:uncharacterized protein (TIGR03437 family)